PGYLTVIIFQGALIFFMVYHGAHPELSLQVPPLGMLSAALLIGGFYPLTQIYQHASDARDGVRTLSAMLGYKGTFIFSAIVYSMAFVVLALFFRISLEIKELWVFATFMIPVIVYFMYWAGKVWRNPAHAGYAHTMRMNLIASLCTSLGFIVVFLMHCSLR
ncbi:MAG TPA: prenyltransferase, partial [Puia sp.]